MTTQPTDSERIEKLEANLDALFEAVWMLWGNARLSPETRQTVKEYLLKVKR